MFIGGGFACEPVDFDQSRPDRSSIVIFEQRRRRRKENESIQNEVSPPTPAFFFFGPVGRCCSSSGELRTEAEMATTSICVSVTHRLWRQWLDPASQRLGT